MTSILSPSAIHRIIILIENDDRPTGILNARCGNCSLAALSLTPRYSHVLPRVNSKWKALYELYTDITPAPPLDYLDSPELVLVLKGEVDDAEIRAIFAHGKPLKFWGCPPLLVSKIVEAFGKMQNKPECLEVTVIALDGLGATRPSDAWSEAYTAHLPCHACTAVETVDAQSIPQQRYPSCEDPVENVDIASEKFHVSSESFGKHLNVELHYELVPGTSGTNRKQSPFIHKVTIRLSDEICSSPGRLSGTANRSSATPLLLPDFASEVFGFLERAHVGSSLLANRGLHDLIGQLKQRLPVHHLKCAFDEELLGGGCRPWFSGAYWLVIGHFQRDLSYTDVRRFKIPSAAGAVNDCALIRRYFNNSHMVDLRAPRQLPAAFPFTVKMLASLAARNFSVGSMELCVEAERLSDYRSMDVVFGGLRMRSLSLTMAERRFVELVKTADFFRMSTVQRLRTLKLTLTQPWNEAKERRGRASSKSPLWVSGIYLLRNCQRYQVDYLAGRHMRRIERKIVQICQEFERGKITTTVEHFMFVTSSTEGMNYAFNRQNLLVSGLKVEGKSDRDATTTNGTSIASGTPAQATT